MSVDRQTDRQTKRMSRSMIKMPNYPVVAVGTKKKGNRVKMMDGTTRMLRPVVASRPTVALVKAVAKKVVSDSLEDKYQTRLNQTSGYPRLYDAGILNVSPLLPVINQGTESNERIGDKIRPKRMRVDFTLSANYAIPSSIIANVRLIVMNDKAIKSTPDLLAIAGVQPGTPIATELLQYASTLAGYTSTPTDDVARVNYERYSVIKDIRKEVIKGAGLGPIVTNSFVGDQVFVSPQTVYRFSVTIPTPKVLKYSNATDLYPSNFAPFFVLGYTDPNGNTGNTPDNWLTQRIALNFVTHLDYEDA